MSNREASGAGKPPDTNGGSNSPEITHRSDTPMGKGGVNKSPEIAQSGTPAEPDPASMQASVPPGTGSSFQPEDRHGLTLRAGGLATSLSLVILGCIVMVGSLQQGIGWDDAGPMAGAFPFYIGLFLTASSLGTALNTLRNWPKGRADMTSRVQLKRVLAVFIPICVYVLSMPFLGMYVPSGLFIAWFMWRMAEGGTRHSLLKLVLISVLVPVASYFIFARWFEVQLYAGPFPAWFGL